MDNQKNAELKLKENCQIKQDFPKEPALSPKKSCQQKLPDFDNRKSSEEQNQISFENNNSNISNKERKLDAVRHNSSNLQIRQEAQGINKRAGIIGNIAKSIKQNESKKR